MIRRENAARRPGPEGVPRGPTMPHWEYHALLPTGNQRLQVQWDKASYEVHRRKLEEELALKIERDNSMLLEKLALIKRTNGLKKVHSESSERKSMSGERRKQELLRVSRENQVLLVRLGQCRSFYSVKAWHDEWLKTLKVMESITQYPPRHRTEVKQEMVQRLQEKSSKRGSEEKTNGDASKNHLMINKTKVEKQINKEPENTS